MSAVQPSLIGIFAMVAETSGRPWAVFPLGDIRSRLDLLSADTICVTMENQLHLTCPHCDSVNRIPESRLAESPACGSCHKPLFTGHPLTLTDANVEKVLARNDIPIVVDCWAAWCGPCRQFAPSFEKAAAAFEPRIRFAKLDTDANPQSSARFQIRSIPTLILFGGGEEIARQSGALPYGAFTQWLLEHLQA
ncbi:MAG: thioredoxin TrxC [Pseudomonadota bacterium]|nr:thioredoxin TrxC [Pseudomonadota bacterium]